MAKPRRRTATGYRAPLPSTDPRPDPTFHPAPQGGPSTGGNWKPDWKPDWRPGGGGNGGGGNGGEGNNGGGGNKPAPAVRMRRRATNDVMASYQPMLDAIERAKIEAEQQYKSDSGRVGDIYGALVTQLQPLTGQYKTANTEIANDLTSQIGGLANLLGSSVEGVPQSEITAGTNSVGTQGAGTLETLASDRARNVGYNTSAVRQGGIEGMTASRNYLQDYQDLLDQISQRSLDLTSETPALIRQRIGELRDQQWQKEMANKEFGLRAAAAAAQAKGDKAMYQYLMEAINGLDNGPKMNTKLSRRNPNGDGTGTTAFNDVLSGRTSYRQLTPAQRQQVDKVLMQRKGAIIAAYQRLGYRMPPGANPGRNELLNMLKKVGVGVGIGGTT